jgi:hypothetical protein
MRKVRNVFNFCVLSSQKIENSLCNVESYLVQCETLKLFQFKQHCTRTIKKTTLQLDDYIIEKMCNL